MQVIEDGKKCILALFCPVEELYIINDQYVNQLVKMYEIIDGIIAAVVYELIDEFLGTDIQYHFIMVGSSHFIADRLGQMGFSQTHPTINDQGIE